MPVTRTPSRRSRSGPLHGLGLRRLGATTADVVAVAVLAIPLTALLGWDPGSLGAFERLLWAVGNAVVFGLYVVPFLHRDGTTPGKRLAGLRVVTAGDGGESSVGAAILRDPVLKLLVFGSLANVVHPTLGFVTLAIDLAPGLLNGDGRTLHDRLTGTTVIGTY